MIHIFKTFVWTLCLICFSTSGSTQSSFQDSLLADLHKVHLISDSGTFKKSVSRLYHIITEDGDTLASASISAIQITSPRKFNTSEDYLKYLKYKRYAASVYPYAKEAIRIFKEAEYVTAHMKKRKKSRYLKRLAKELESEFEKPLGGLSKTQGKIMIKMIEKELERPIYNLIKDTRGSWKAFYWNQFSKLYGYRLKEGYAKGDNPILDVVFQDFDISYTIVEK